MNKEEYKEGYAEFTVSCPKMGFRRSHFIPLDSRGWASALANDLDAAFEFYLLKVENRKLQDKIKELELRHET